MPRPIDPTVELEQRRLEALISAVWDDGHTHYSHDCDCASCNDIRNNLSVADRVFIDHVSKTVLHKGNDA